MPGPQSSAAFYFRMQEFDPTLPRFVFDTNIILDFFVFDDPGSKHLLNALHEGRILSFCTPSTLEELRIVLSRSIFSLLPEKQTKILEKWKQLSVSLEDIPQEQLKCRDADDNKFLDLAFQVKPATLISKDKLVLKVRSKARKYGIVIHRPDQHTDFEKQ